MTLFVALLRLIHIFDSVFWVGTTFFMVGILTPTVRGAGPEGGRFMQRLVREGHISQALTVAALLTVVSGILLYWHDSANFNPQWIMTKAGLALTIGGLAGLAAFGHGGAVVGRMTARLSQLGQTIAAAGGPPTPAQTQELQTLQDRLQRNTVITAVLMSVALIGMSVAQVL